MWVMTRKIKTRRTTLLFFCPTFFCMTLLLYPSSKANNTEREIIFRDVAKAAGIHFVHDNAATAEKYLIETMGSGCGWIDYNADGLLDLYLANGAATRLYKPKKPLRSALYRNNGDGTFTDVTEKTGVGGEGLF